MQANIRELIIGVQYTHNFRFLDHSGGVLDNILNNGNKYFPEGFFENISVGNGMERELRSKNGDSLKITSSNVVFTQVVDPKEDQTKTYKIFADRVKNYIVPIIISENSLVVRRLGVVYNCEIPQDGIKKMKAIFLQDSTGVTDLRFSKRESTVKGALWSDKSDYINKIFTIGELHDFNGVSYDYQLYFVPPHAEIRPDISDFLKDGQAAFKADITDVIGAE